MFNEGMLVFLWCILVFSGDWCLLDGESWHLLKNGGV